MTVFIAPMLHRAMTLKIPSPQPAPGLEANRRRKLARTSVSDSYLANRTTGRIRRMASSLIGLPSRFALFVCGMISVALSRIYLALQGLDPSSHGWWSLFSGILVAVGGFAIVFAVLPGSWVEKLCKIDPDKLSLVPIKMLGIFAVVSYLLVVALYFVPPSGHPSPVLAFSVCPACALTITVDPSLGTVLAGLAPLSAAVYGSLGGVLGYLLVVFRQFS
jgi:uncharacterized BrkB/YihY/UPF0761 family membrane protein